ncbi:hypothetical protein SAMN02745121_08250 [Nannocystis exedens]|uniref:PKD domain-containing protein n=1 Tax=Nannocystis exedens TaxID=54 RepID=A0A1I2HZH0_9BACT|nr:hypothetical protein [Nannocystis exedens]PCC72020.1 hypothetical protein NAEX_05099 [Nannocystis exedens]SFF33996.1 hypothetical protein SAMN02745121_08250 [Nannocystis exedens]
MANARRRSPWLTSSSATASVCVLLHTAACTPEGGRCEVVETKTLADDEASPQGMSALDVLALAQPHEAAFQWDLTADGDNPTNADPQVATSVSVTVERGPGDVRYVVTEQRGDTEEDAGCGPSLYVPIRLRIVTGDGALDDTFTGDLVYGAEKPGIAWITAAFAFDDLAGTLRPSVSGSAGEVHVEFGAEPRGWIAVRDETQGANAVTEAWAMAGHWGDVPPLE